MIGAVIPRAIDNAESYDVAFAFVTTVLLFTGFFNVVAFFFALVTTPSSDIIESHLMYSGNRSTISLKR